MRNILVLLALALVAACASGGSDGGVVAAERQESASAECQPSAQAERQESRSAEGAEQAAVTHMRQSTGRQWTALYDSLHPEHQRLVTCEQFVECAPRRILTLRPDTEFDVVDIYEDQVTIPGTATRADSTTLVVKTSSESPGRPVGGSFTVPLVYVDGTWRWWLADPHLYRDCDLYP
ncbi:MAG TPA: hypothetical protein VFI46_14200 [Jiangellaceae bacterium]|nr:hypothetical protein [Jiangellaceae bacterium]